MTNFSVLTENARINFEKGAEMEQIIEMLAHIEMCVTGMTICTVIIMVMAILTAVNSFFDK